jgi:hypothetical protein
MNFAAALVPSCAIAATQTRTIRANITAYSTAVGPSLETKKRWILFSILVLSFYSFPSIKGPAETQPIRGSRRTTDGCQRPSPLSVLFRKAETSCCGRRRARLAGQSLALIRLTRLTHPLDLAGYSCRPVILRSQWLDASLGPLTNNPTRSTDPPMLRCRRVVFMLWRRGIAQVMPATLPSREGDLMMH